MDMDMNMNFSISSPARSQFVSYSLPSHGLAIPSWIDVDDSRNIAEYLQSRSEADEILWRSSNNMTPLFLDYKPNSRLQRVGVEEENGLYDESSDEFRMYKFKVVICTKESSHDWTECPFAHRGERARRRDPNLYCGETCPEYKKGYCRKGLTCEFAHGLFETWLHPQRYRTQRCKDGIHCNRRVCFFAHNDGELRSTSVSSPSNLKHMQQSASSKGGSNGYSSPRRYACTNVLIPQTYHGLGLQQESFPGVAVPAHVVLSPSFMNSSPSPSSNSVSSGSLPGSSLGSPCGLEDVVAALRNVDLSNDEFNYTATQSVLQNHVNGDKYTLERSSESGLNCGLHRLDSGKNLRAEIYKKYWKDQLPQEYSVCAADQPDLAWVSELVEEV